MMSTIKDVWIDLFDNSLEIYKNEDNSIRNIAMILHIFQLEFEKLTKSFLDLKLNNELQAKELNYLNNLTCQCKTKLRSPLQSLIENKNTQKSDSTSNSNVSYEGSENLSNDLHISELDANLKENDNSMFSDDSFVNAKLSTSPTLNSYKRRSRSSKASRKQNRNSSIIQGTPVLSISKVKKLKQSKLSLSTTSFSGSSTSKNCSIQCDNKPSASTSIHKYIRSDDDETLVLDKVVVKDNVDEEQLNVKTPSPQKKKTKLDNSYDCIPVALKSPGTPTRRKKTDRLNMRGWDCPDCERYYANMNLSDGEMKRKMDRCSKHRNNVNPNRNTPEGFWDPDVSPTQDYSFFFNLT